MSSKKTCNPEGRPCPCTERDAHYNHCYMKPGDLHNVITPPPEPVPIPANPKAIHGAAKPNLALIPAAASLQIAPVFALGAEKYGRYNWRKDAVESETYMAAAMRHMAAWFDGEDIDEESGQPHIAHAAACMMILLDAKACDKLIDDRPHKGVAAQMVRDMTKPIEG